MLRVFLQRYLNTMKFVLQPWQIYLVILASWINRQQQIVIEYLRTEKQVLKEKLGKKRILLNDDARLAWRKERTSRKSEKHMFPKTTVPVVLSMVVCFAHLSWAGDFQELKSQNWHQWRGPHANGVSSTADPPATWSERENILWKVAVDGHGNTTPIVWGDKVFLLTTIDTGRADPTLTPPNEQPDRPFGIKYPNTYHQYVVLCLDRNTGQELWRRVAAEEVPKEGHHGDNSFATASPTTDGQRLYAWFGSAGLYCYDLEGSPNWNRDLGPVKTRLSFGEGSSPVVHDYRVMIIRDQEDQSYLVVLDARSGETVWQVDRDEPSAWATPLVVEQGGDTQVITNGENRVRSYNLKDGKLIWECGGQVSNVTPSPVATADTVFCMSGYRGSALYALPLDATGDLTDTAEIRWTKSSGTPYVPSPLLYEGLLYFNQSNNPIMSCLDTEMGDIVIDRTRMPGIKRLYASPVGANGRIYFAGRDGTTLVLERSRNFKIIATNQLDEGVDASPALVGNQLFLRGKSHLYCIASGR